MFFLNVFCGFLIVVGVTTSVYYIIKILREGDR